MKHKDTFHVVYIITKLELGGAQKVCLELFNGLRDANISSHLISGTKGTLIDEVKENKDVILLDAFTREITIISLLNEFRCFWHLLKQLYQLKKKYPNIIVHTHSTKAGILGRWAAWFAGITIRIHTIHGYAFHHHQSWLLWIPIYCIELITSFITSHYICVSSADIITGTRLFPFFARKCSLIRAAIDQQQFYIPAHTTSMETDQTAFFIFGTIACFKPQKNLFDLLNAFAHVHEQNPHTRLEIIGDGIQRHAIEEWIAHHMLGHAITLHGWQTDVASIMLTWNAFVLSSLWEGLPCAIIEARLLKLPVISYDTGGIKDVIMHEKNGLLYQQKDWSSLAHGMLMLTRDHTLHQKLQTYVDNLDDFNTIHMVNKHILLYKELITNKTEGE